MRETPISLKGAMPYIRLYKGKTFVVKVGGAVLAKRGALEALAAQVGLLSQLGIRIVLVHGGGEQASALSRRLGAEPVIVAGRRVTDDEALEVAKMVYGGSLNVEVVAALRAQETSAVGLSGVDAGLLTARRRPLARVAPGPGEAPIEVDFGHVGDVVEVRPAVLERLLEGGIVPVVACLAADAKGAVLNVNADSVAESLARGLRAEKLLLLTSVDGLLQDPADPGSLVSYTDIEGVDALKASGALSGGMLPKAEACVRALRDGVKRVHVLNGLRPDALLVEVFTNAGCGTLIVGCVEEAGPVPAEAAPA